MAQRLTGRLLPSLIGAVGVTLWATETTLINLALNIPPLETVALAFGFAAMLTPFVWLVTGENPFKAFRLPKRVWLLMVLSLVGYHACIYFATQRAPAAPAAMLQGTTPLLIVLGSALLPGERLRWWHMVGAGLGFAGVLSLINLGGALDTVRPDAMFYLSLVGIAAGLWGLYSVVTRSLPDVPTSSLGMFYAASSLLAFLIHLPLEPWVTPTGWEWLVIAGMGILPMGLAIYFWDFGVKRGDIQALGVFSYAEPFIGAVLVALVAHAPLRVELFWSGALVIGGAIFASAGLWKKGAAVDAAPDTAPADPATAAVPPPAVVVPDSPDVRAELTRLGDRVIAELVRIAEEPATNFAAREVELRSLITTLGVLASTDRLLSAEPGTPAQAQGSVSRSA